MKHVLVLGTLATLCAATGFAQTPAGNSARQFKVAKYNIGGDGGTDYVTARRT